MANQLENKALNLINRLDRLDEGFLSNAFIRVAFSKKAKKAFKRTGKEMKKNPEFKAAVIDLQKSTERVNDLIASYCDKYPDSAQCD